jgi:aldehyde dehydrogenase (NAD+)
MIDPCNGETFAHIGAGGARDIDLAVKAAQAALDGVWGKTSAGDRGRILFRFARLIEDHVEELALMEATDTGKPLNAARIDIQVTARYFEFYGGAADKLHGQVIPFLDGYTVNVLREPHGVTGHIIPWNYPAQQYGRTVGAALAAGNAVVLKPSEDACLSTLKMSELAMEAGLPPGALNVVTGLGETAGAALTAHPGVSFLSFTGSPEVGQLVQTSAARNHIPCTLELGGKSPQVVFADADLDAALPVLTAAIIQNAGQTCSAGSRVLIERPVYDQVMQRLASAFSALQVGAGQADLDCGPIINAKQCARVQGFIDQARAAGIAVAAAGALSGSAPRSGFYVVPTLFADVPANHRLTQEEVFGPVLAASSFDDEAEALRLANGTPYGLVAGLWTRDGARQMRMARKLHAGQVFVNNYGAGGGVELPFGGVKHSGYGREKGFEALLGFTSLKTVAIRHD